MKLRETLQFADSDTCVKVYDPTKQQLIAVYENYNKASNRLGITAAAILRRCAQKSRVWSPMMNMEIAIRLTSVKEGDSELIEKTKNCIKIR